MFRSTILIFTLLFAFYCGDGVNTKACFEENNQGACMDLCDQQDNQQACAKHTEIGTMKCLEGNDVQACFTWCAMARSGNQLFCERKDQLCGQPENAANEVCAE
jgi:hypothetical protein